MISVIFARKRPEARWGKSRTCDYLSRKPCGERASPAVMPHYTYHGLALSSRLFELNNRYAIKIEPLRSSRHQ